MNWRYTLVSHLKNIPGWKTGRKLVVFSVDDYGNVRIASRKASDELIKAGIKPASHFDRFDSLETHEDLEALFEVLSSVKDKHGNPAVFTPYAIPCNISFEAMADMGNSMYINELLPVTFNKLAAEDLGAYEGTWELWKEGIEKGLMRPQFHGREHFNLYVFNDLLGKQNKNLLTALQHHSHVSLPEHKNYRQGWTSAFDFETIDEIEPMADIIRDGLSKFEQVYGYMPNSFTPPARNFPVSIEQKLSSFGLDYFDMPVYQNRMLDNGKYRREIHKLGDRKPLPVIIRNIPFEPTTKNLTSDWVNFTLKQIRTAFFWGKPAHISSHRVNFSGHIDPNNRKEGLNTLKILLQKIARTWPDVEFISVEQLGRIVYE